MNMKLLAISCVIGSTVDDPAILSAPVNVIIPVSPNSSSLFCSSCICLLYVRGPANRYPRIVPRSIAIIVFCVLRFFLNVFTFLLVVEYHWINKLLI